MDKHDDPKDKREEKSHKSNDNNNKKEFDFEKNKDVIRNLGTEITASSIEINNFVFAVNEKLYEGFESERFKNYSKYTLNTSISMQRNIVTLISLVQERQDNR